MKLLEFLFKTESGLQALLAFSCNVVLTIMFVIFGSYYKETSFKSKRGLILATLLLFVLMDFCILTLYIFLDLVRGI